MRKPLHKGWVLAAALVCGPAVAGELNAQERLQAIRAALVDAAMKSNTRVSSTSWMDAQGSMRELNRFSSDIKLRELQVEKYSRDAAQQPQAELVSAVEPALASRCEAPLAKGSIKQVMTVGLDLSPQLQPSQKYLAQQVGLAVRARLLEQASQAQRWRLVTEPVHHSAYNRMSYSHGEEHIQWHLQISLMPASIEASAEDQSGYQIQWQVRAPGQREAWLLEHDTVVTTSTVGVPGTPKIDSSLAQTIRQAAQRVAQQLDQRLACEPQALAVSSPERGRVSLNAGSKAGLRVGDQLMVADGRVLPQHALEPGALDAAVLAEVKSVTAYQAELKQVAGKPQKMQGGWVAWPYTY